MLHEPNVGDCVLARYRFEQGNVSGVVWKAGEMKQVYAVCNSAHPLPVHDPIP